MIAHLLAVLPVLALLAAAAQARAAEQPPHDDGTEGWYVFAPTNDTGPSVVGMADWLGQPAGTHGPVVMQGDRLAFEDGTPVRFWGVCRHPCKAPATHAQSEALAAGYAKWGINAVRDAILFGAGWEGIGDPHDTTRTVPQLQDDYDFLCAEWRKRGIYHGISAFWSHKLRAGDRTKIRHFDEAQAHANALENIADDVQDLHIAAVVGFLKHENPYTGLTYAEDHSLSSIEIRNEQDIYWFGVAEAIGKCPQYQAEIRQRFCAWLKQRYGTQERLVAAWGGRCLGTLPGCAKDETIDAGTMHPFFNAWFFSPEGLADQEQHFGAKRRLLDCAEFLSEVQTAYYERFAKAIRATGYQGLIVGSDWQAGSGVSHLYNLLSDRSVGHIDRHNYFGGTGKHPLEAGKQDNESMLWRPGSALLSTGMQQVADRPFGMSEWCAMTPNEWIAEGPVLMGLYGMGLQGWDALYQSFGNFSGFSPTLADRNGQVYNAQGPTQTGLYPAIARAIARGDIAEGAVVAARRFTRDDLRSGTLDFAETVAQKADVKEISGATPLEALAVGRVVLEPLEQPQPSLIPDLGEQIARRTLVSNTGQLRWTYASHDEAYVTVDSGGTQGVAGFAAGRMIALKDTTMTVDTRFAVVLVTALGRTETLADAQTALVTVIARARNTGMVYDAARDVTSLGTAPILMEPVRATVTFKRPPLRVVLLDHDGRRTERMAHLEDATLTIDGVTDQTLFYEVAFAP
jgi:hypothetical protein